MLMQELLGGVYCTRCHEQSVAWRTTSSELLASGVGKE
jgi:hypothetical protein